MDGDFILRILRLMLVWVFVPLGSCTEYLGNAGPEHCGAVEGDEVWAKGANPHIITCSTTISGSVIIGPGTKILFSEGAELVVTGGLSVEGKSDDPVLFEAETTQAFAGLSIRGNGGGTSLSHVTFSGGGFSEKGSVGALTIDSGPVKLKNVKILNAFDCGISLSSQGRIHTDSENISIKGSAGFPFCSDVQAAQTIDESIYTLQENGASGVWLTGETMSGYHSWTMTSMPYVVSTTFTLSKADLTIGPGVLVQFDRYNSMIVGSGGGETDARLTTLGELERPVRMTGVDEEPGSWGGLYVNSSGGDHRVHLTHTRLENGGSEYGYGLAMLSMDDNVQVVAQDLVLTGSGGLGFSFGTGSGWSEDSQNITVTNNGATGQMSADQVRSFPPSTDLSGNLLNTVRITSAELEISADWYDYGSSYAATEGLSTSNNGTEEIVFTVAQGVVLEFAADQELELGESGSASVSFLGTPDDPVVLKGMDSDEDGTWYGVQFSGGLSSATWQNVQMYDGGIESGAALRIDGGVLAVDSVHVEGSLGAGFRIRSGGFAEGGKGLTITGNGSTGSAPITSAPSLPKEQSTYSGNTADAITLDESDVVESVALPGLDVPYLVNRDLKVYGTEESPAIFSLEPGTNILFGKESAIIIYEYGGLSALGTAEQNIILSGQSEDPTTWDGIFFVGAVDGLSEIEYVDLGYAGDQGAAIWVNTGNPAIRNSHIHDSTCYAIAVLKPEEGALVENVTYADNACGDYTTTYP